MGATRRTNTQAQANNRRNRRVATPGGGAVGAQTAGAERRARGRARTGGGGK